MWTNIYLEVDSNINLEYLQLFYDETYYEIRKRVPYLTESLIFNVSFVTSKGFNPNLHPQLS